MKLCKHCTHHRDYRGWDVDRCQRPMTMDRSPVDGRLVHRLNANAEAERRTGKTLFGRVRCGAEARFFEPTE